MRRVRSLGVLVGLALAMVLPALPASAAELSAAARKDLAHVATLREQGKAAEAIAALEEAAKNSRQDPVATAAIQFVMADVYRRDLKGEETQKKGRALIARLRMVQLDGPVEIPGLGKVDIQQAALQIQDAQNRHHWLYRLMAGLTGVIANNPVTGRSLAGHSGVLAILLLTVAIKLALTPLTKRSFTSMREMQKLQPLMRDLQQRYGDRREELNRRMMELYKEHGVNPFSGCLPMLLQMPIIILLWRAIDYFQYPLSRESFLWIKSLAAADMPLALIYAASLLLSSKLTMMPTTDPQQAQQQKVMAYMMPVMFFWLFKGYPAGFILGWLFFNVLTTAQQWQLMRDSGAGEGGAADSGGGSGPGGPGPDPAANGPNGGRRAQSPAPAPARGKVAKTPPPASRPIKRKRNMAASQRNR